MTTLINDQRPLVFCPGCSHERVVHALDGALQAMALPGNRVVLVSDIGCSGLFDTFFNTHAFHGLHGRALTYASGIKMARPDLTVIVTMGDGGLGIGGAHVLAACRRNLDITLLVLNNFNFGMTGGQFSATTPPDAVVQPEFLNQLEMPMNVERVMRAAGAGYISRASAHEDALREKIQEAIQYEGFSVVDIQGICTGRYTKHNRISPTMLAESVKQATCSGVVPENQRPEYGRRYREIAGNQALAGKPAAIPVEHEPVAQDRCEVVILGSAGQRIISAGEILCLAGLSSGLHATQKNEYDITVLRGASIAEVILSPTEVEFTGIQRPTMILALAEEGVARRKRLFAEIDSDTLIIRAKGIDLPDTRARKVTVDFTTWTANSKEWAVASLAVLAGKNKVISGDMLQTALDARLSGSALEKTRALVERVLNDPVE